MKGPPKFDMCEAGHNMEKIHMVVENELNCHTCKSTFIPSVSEPCYLCTPCEQNKCNKCALRALKISVKTCNAGHYLKPMNEATSKITSCGKCNIKVQTFSHCQICMYYQCFDCSKFDLTLIRGPVQNLPQIAGQICSTTIEIGPTTKEDCIKVAAHEAELRKGPYYIDKVKSYT